MPQRPGSMIPEETQREIVRLYTEGGLTIREIGTRVHWGQTAVLRVLHLHGVETRPAHRCGARRGDPSYELRERIAEMYRSGLSIKVIAERLHVQRTSIGWHLRRAGVERRDRSESQRVRWARNVALRQGLTERQRLALGVVEESGPVPTAAITRRVGLSSGMTTLEVLGSLERLGLITGRRPSGPGAGPGRMKTWRRTALPVRDVLDRALAPRAGRQVDETMLAIAPFRALLDEVIEREERKARFFAVSREGGDGSGGIPVVDVIAARMGVPQRVIWRWRNEQRTITLTSADKALQAFDGGVTVYDLWPHLAVDDELEAA